MIEINILRAFSDNYLFVIHNGTEAIAVDPGDASVVLEHLQSLNLELKAILLTHHHPDHIGGVTKLASIFNCHVFGNKFDLQLPSVSDKITAPIKLSLMGLDIDVLPLPGHTKNLLGYHFINLQAIFCGDHIFGAGCGRIFDGDPISFWKSIQKVKQLSLKTKIYFAHEYTLQNIKFGLSLNYQSELLKSHNKTCTKVLHDGGFTCPTTVEMESKINPFFRCDDKILQEVLATDNAFECFKKLRELKDIF